MGNEDFGRLVNERQPAVCKIENIKYEMGHPRVWLWGKGFYGVLVCSCVFALPLQAGDPAVERRLNEVYTELRHTLTPAQKEALKQEELNWLKQRDRFSSEDPRWAELTN
jgi:hypothetical protein